MYKKLPAVEMGKSSQSIWLKMELALHLFKKALNLNYDYSFSLQKVYLQKSNLNKFMQYLIKMVSIKRGFKILKNDILLWLLITILG